MMKQRIIALFLCVLLVFQLYPVYALAENEEEAQAEETGEGDDVSAEDDTSEKASEETPEDKDAPALPPELDCMGAILIELNSGTTVFEYNADERLYPASLTKVMTCLLALENGNLSDEITVDGGLLSDMDADASIVGLSDGDKLTMEDLLYCVMVPSANDACLVVADHIAGSVESFVDMMNDKAKALGCTGTHFVNPDGLHDEEHYTTARDLSIITKAALQNETFRTICGTAVHELSDTNTSEADVVYTTNYFMSTALTTKYYWEPVKGVKTGFTTPAGRCLITLVEEGSFSYLSVVLGAKTTVDEAGEAVFGSFTESKKLIEYGLENFSFVSVLSRLSPIAQVPVSSGAVHSVVIAPAQDVSALLPVKYKADRISISYTLNDGDSLSAPLTADQIVGTATVSYEGNVIGQSEVRTIAAVDRNKVLAAPTKDDPAFLRLLPIIIILLAVVLLVIARLNRRKNRRRKKRRKA